jgi:hypothetical protein
MPVTQIAAQIDTLSFFHIIDSIVKVNIVSTMSRKPISCAAIVEMNYYFTG